MGNQKARSANVTCRRAQDETTKTCPKSTTVVVTPLHPTVPSTFTVSLVTSPRRLAPWSPTLHTLCRSLGWAVCIHRFLKMQSCDHGQVDGLTQTCLKWEIW